MELASESVGEKLSGGDITLSNSVDNLSPREEIPNIWLYRRRRKAR